MLVQHGLFIRDIFRDGFFFPTDVGNALRIRQNILRDCQPTQKSRSHRERKHSTTSQRFGKHSLTNYFLIFSELFERWRLFESVKN